MPATRPVKQPAVVELQNSINRLEAKINDFFNPKSCATLANDARPPITIPVTFQTSDGMKSIQLDVPSYALCHEIPAALHNFLEIVTRNHGEFPNGDRLGYGIESIMVQVNLKQENAE